MKVYTSKVMLFPAAMVKRCLRIMLIMALVMPLPTLAAHADWNVDISATAGATTTKITLGKHSAASDAHDLLYDAPAFNGSSASGDPAEVLLYFDHADWGVSDTQFWFDIKAPGRQKQWDFKTSSPLTNSSLTLEWDISALPNDYTLILTDVAGGATINMLTQTSYTLPDNNLRLLSVTAVHMEPPLLVIASPLDGAVVSNPNLTISGTATDAGQGDSGVQSVTVNSEPATGGTVTGTNMANWSFVTTLNPGVNSFTIVATDDGAYNDQATQTITVTYSATDTDVDGLQDAWEITHFGNLTTAGATSDVDGDGLLDTDEYTQGTDPNLNDSDSDGLLDGAEIILGTSPLLADTDGDGDSDGDEVMYGSLPLVITDTLNSHRPAQPIITPLSGEIALAAQVLDVTGFSDPDALQGDYLTASEWEIGTDVGFTESGIKLRKMLTKKSGSAIDAIEHRQLVVPDALLAIASNYWIRTRHQDSVGLWSPWSNALAVSSGATNPNDLTNDGIDDRYQITGFTDTNGNGADDSGEGIRAIMDASRVNQIGIHADAGTLDSITAVATSTIPAAHLDAVSTPYGFFSYRIDGLAVDPANPAVAHVTFYFPAALPTGTSWYSYDPTTDTMSDLSANVVISGNTATLTLVDGGAGDKDGIVNGTIVDPGGPTQPVAVNTGSGGSSGGLVGPLTLFAILFLLLMRRRIH